MDTEIVLEAEESLLNLTFMRSKTKPATTKAKRPSLIEMTREEFKDRLNQHKVKDDRLIH